MLIIASKCVVLHADSEFTVENRFGAYFRIVFQYFRFSDFFDFELLNCFRQPYEHDPTFNSAQKEMAFLLDH